MSLPAQYRVWWYDEKGLGFENTKNWLDTKWPDLETELGAEELGALHVAHWPDDIVWIEEVPQGALSLCFGCGWEMPADDEEAAEAQLAVHEIVTFNGMVAKEVMA